MDTNRLKAIIVEVYGSEENFAQDLGISNSKLNSLLSQKSQMDLELIHKFVDKLKIAPEEISSIFFGR